MTQNLSSHGIGASEIAAIAGLNPYASPWDVWARKTGRMPEVTAPMEWGLRLEPAIRQAYVDHTGNTVAVPPSSLFHREAPWARATPDGFVLDGDRRVAVVQTKNVGTWVERQWNEAPPAYVQLQEQWELYVTELERADVAALIGGSDFRIYTVHRDDTVIADLVTIGEEFWQRVETGKPPKIDDSEACRDHFTRKLRPNTGVELEAVGEIAELMRTWREQHAEAKRIDKALAKTKNRVLAELAEAKADRLVSEEHGIATLRAGTATAYPETNWKLVAELLSARCKPEEWHELVAANTTTVTKQSKTALYPPSQWAKDAER